MSLDAGRVGVRADQVDIHGRVTSPSFLNELLEDLPEWTDMPVWVNDTEELLPSNNSVPVTSPILADIAYPDIRRDNQYFTYRESPTPVDGLAKIKSIKGNTLVWNQLVQNGNFADTSLWRTYASTGFSVSNNVGSFTVTEATGAIYQTSTPTYASGHKYLVIADFYVSRQTNISVEVSGTRGQTVSVNANTWYRYSDIVTPSAQGNFSLTCGQASVQVKNVMCFDLTKMGLDITDPSDFTSLFPLSYYDYNQGTLLSFNGNGIKTVGRNLFDENLISQVADIGYAQIFVGDGTFEISTTTPNNGQANVFLLSGYATSGASTANNGVWDGRTRRVVSNNGYVTVATRTAGTPLINPKDYETILYKYDGETVSYEPYTSHTTNLPVSTYFPTGMKSAGNVYDELTPTKAITRIGAVDLGSLTWNYTGGRFQTSKSNISPQPSATSSIICSQYPYSASAEVDKTITQSASYFRIYDSSYTDAQTFKTAMSGVYLYYELATPVELPTLSLGE